MAQEHLKYDHALSDNLLYRCCTTDDLLRGNANMEDRDDVEDRGGSMEGTFDCVVASEVVEHVRNVDTFVGHLSQLVKVLGEKLCIRGRTSPNGHFL